MIDVKKEIIKGNVKEGDCLIKENNYFIIDKKATEDRKNFIHKKIKEIWR